MSATSTQSPPEAVVETGHEPVASETRRHAVFLERGSDRSQRFGTRFFRDLGRGILIVVLLHVFVLQISVVRGLSMEPSLHDGDRLIVDRLSYSFGEVERFDVIVLMNPRDRAVDYVKRVVGLPGECVRIRSGVVEIDGQPVEVEVDLIDDDANMPELIVPSGHFFVLGDNRPVSCDSREFGLVQHELIKGKVRVRFWPLSRLAVF